MAKYFDNTITGTSTPNFKLYIQSLGQTIHIAGILLKISYKIIILDTSPSPTSPFTLTNYGINCADNRPCNLGASCITSTCNSK